MNNTSRERPTALNASKPAASRTDLRRSSSPTIVMHLGGTTISGIASRQFLKRAHASQRELALRRGVQTSVGDD